MGFPSPAADYVHARISVIDYCNIGANSIVIETSAGHAVVDKYLPCTPGCIVLIQHSGRYEFAKPMGRALITDDGEAIEGEALDEVNVLGRVTHFINRTFCRMPF